MNWLNFRRFLIICLPYFITFPKIHAQCSMSDSQRYPNTSIYFKIMFNLDSFLFVSSLTYILKKYKDISRLPLWIGNWGSPSRFTFFFTKIRNIFLFYVLLWKTRIQFIPLKCSSESTNLIKINLGHLLTLSLHFPDKCHLDCV